MFRKNVYILGAGFSANAGAPVMKDFVERAKLLRDDPRLGLPAEDQKTFDRVFKRLAELRNAQAKMTIDNENMEHLFSLLDMDIEFGGKNADTLRQDLIFLILRTLEKTTFVRFTVEDLVWLRACGIDPEVSSIEDCIN